MAEAEESKPRIQVKRRKIMRKPALDAPPVEQYRITFWSREHPPRSFWIDVKEWSAEKEKTIIRELLAEREAEESETVSL